MKSTFTAFMAGFGIIITSIGSIEIYKAFGASFLIFIPIAIGGYLTIYGTYIQWHNKEK